MSGIEAVRSLFLGTILNPSQDAKSVDILEDHLIGVDHDGVIRHFQISSSEASAELLSYQAKHPDSVDLTTVPINGFLLPGFVDTHLHAPQYLNSGVALDRPLMEWLVEYTYKAEASIDADPDGVGATVYHTLVKRLVENGTTCVACHGTQSVEANMVLAKAFIGAGIRGYVGKVNQDINSPPYYTEATSTSLARTTEFIARIKSLNSPLVAPVITPRFIPTCSDELLRGIAKIATEEGCRVMSHASEAGDQVAFTKSLKGDREDAEIFEELGILGPKTLMAHCTHLTPQCEALFLSSGTSIAHCPLSNVYFSERPFKLRETLTKGIKVGLGCDVAGGYKLPMQDAMRNAVMVSRAREGQRKDGLGIASEVGRKTDPSQEPTNTVQPAAVNSLAITWKESLYLATLGGATALAAGEAFGSFKVGKYFDAQLIEVGNMERGSRVDLFLDARRTKGISKEDIVEKWWCSGDERDRVAVWCMGKKVM